jgi:CubicO group peptidase (beta-lactamase class C family)
MTSNGRMAGRRRALVALGVVAALLLAACSSDDDSADDPNSDGSVPATSGDFPEDGPPGNPAQTVTSDDVDAGLERVPEQAEQLLEASGVPGMAITVVFEDEVVFAEGFGVRDVEGDDEIGPDTVFQVASLSKPLAATVVAGLVGQGDLAWDDPVVEHLPDFELSDPYVTENVTIADMFAHRSGLPPHAGDLLEDLGYDREQILERLAQEPLAPFRAEHQYTNFGLTAAAVAAADTAGTTWEDAGQDVLFGPAGMEDSSFTFEDYEAADSRALPHVRDEDGEWVPSEEQRQPDAQAPAGGASSTAEDMAQWLRILLGDGELGDEPLIDADALREVTVPHSLLSAGGTPSSRPSSYGLGMNLGTRDDGFVTWSHSGAFLLGTGTAMSVVPGQQLAVSVLTNGQPVGAAEAMAEIVLDDIIDGEVSRDWFGLYGQLFAGLYEPETPTDWSEQPDDPAEPQDLTTYEGTYENDYYGPMEVAVVDGHLVAMLGPDEVELVLTPYDGDTFLFTPPGENTTTATGMAFEVDGDTAVSVTSELYDENGLGTWERT